MTAHAISRYFIGVASLFYHPNRNRFQAILAKVVLRLASMKVPKNRPTAALTFC
jgi:hypothetical protein